MNGRRMHPKQTELFLVVEMELSKAAIGVVTVCSMVGPMAGASRLSLWIEVPGFRVPHRAWASVRTHATSEETVLASQFHVQRAVVA